jgi:hypothetical protein
VSTATPTAALQRTAQAVDPAALQEESGSMSYFILAAAGLMIAVLAVALLARRILS